VPDVGSTLLKLMFLLRCGSSFGDLPMNPRNFWISVGNLRGTLLMNLVKDVVSCVVVQFFLCGTLIYIFQ